VLGGLSPGHIGGLPESFNCVRIKRATAGALLSHTANMACESKASNPMSKAADFRQTHYHSLTYPRNRVSSPKDGKIHENQVDRVDYITRFDKFNAEAKQKL
jgi:hypothetical protein